MGRVRDTEERLAATFDPVADGYHVLRLLANEQVTVSEAARRIQKILRGHWVRPDPFEFHKKLTGKNKEAGPISEHHQCSYCRTASLATLESAPLSGGLNDSDGDE